MNADLPDQDPSFAYYDSDHPAEEGNPYPENFDNAATHQGIRYDIRHYVELAADIAGNGQHILELFCGTGRVALALARAGYPVTGVDVSVGVLKTFEDKLTREEPATRSRVTLVNQDVTRLNLEQRDFPLAICALNSLLCITDFKAQRQALAAIAGHIRPRGTLLVDLVNPLRLNLTGDSIPEPVFTRRNVTTGRQYTRFDMSDPIDTEQRQRLHGWYDEYDEAGTVTRTFHSLWLRPIFRYEMELMLNEAGFDVKTVEGGHQGEVYTARSDHIFIYANRRPT